MKKPLLGLIALAFATSVAFASSVTIYPTSPEVASSSTVGAPGNSAPGFGTGAVANNGSGTKSEIYIPVADLFTGSVTIRDIASVSYWTNKPGSAGDPDWGFYLYTNTTGSGDEASWYHSRLVSEPYFTSTPSVAANDWHEWSTDDPNNPMRFYDTGRDGIIFGTYSDPTLAAIHSGAISWPSGSAYDYNSDTIKFFGFQTGSGWTNGFTGMLDGLTVTLNDGRIGTVNFEASPAAVPEPGSVMLLGTGLAGIAANLRRRFGR